MSLTLHRVLIPSSEDDQSEDEQMFIFSLDGVSNLCRDVKNIESSEFNFGGNAWSLVCAKKDDNVGLFIKWKYPDSTTAKEISVKTKFVLTIMHQRKSHSNISFVSSTQKFSASQTLLGKSKMILLDELLNPVNGYLDETGKMAMVEVRMIGCSVRYESTVDVTPKSRTRKNASGVYFDSNLFHLGNQRWFLRFYILKINSNGLPAVYLYLHNGSPGITTQFQFILFMGKECTEILEYDFGEGAKFDGFGKTLPEPFPSPEKLTELNVACEITKQKVYKFVPVRMLSMLTSRTLGSNVSNRRSPISFGNSIAREKLKLNKLSPFDSSNQVFQDHYGNPWKVEFSKDIYTHASVAFYFEKGIYHYPNNKSTIACVQAYIMSNDLSVAQDIPMSNGGPIVGYYSNFSDDKGSMMNFNLNPALLTDSKGGYLNEDNEVTVRVDFVSIQTTPFSVRSGPKYDLYVKHLNELKQEMGDTEKSIGSKLKEMSASRASLSILDERPPSGSSYSSGLGFPNTKNESESFERTRSIDSLNSSSNGRSSPSGMSKRVINEPNNSSITSLQEFLNNLAHYNEQKVAKYREPRNTDNCLKNENNKSPVANLIDDVQLIKTSTSNSTSENKHKEIVTKLVECLKQIFPLQITDIVLLGSLGTQTTASSRSDVDIIVSCKNLPRVNYKRWLPALLQTIKSIMSQSLINLSTTQTGVTADLSYSTFHVTDQSIQVSINSEIDVDIFLASDWPAKTEALNNVVNQSPASKIDLQVIKSIFGASINNASEFDVKCLDLSCSNFRKIFLNELKPEIKDYIKVIKHWRNSIQWTKLAHRPDSYLILLLVIRSAELCEKNGPSLFEVMEMFGRLLKEPELKISWNWFYNPVEFSSLQFDPPTPLILDPINPAVNVAARLKYWGQFKAEYYKWLKDLKIST